MKNHSKTKTNWMNKSQRQRVIFYSLLVALPFLQFLIFYVGVNINTILLAFQKYDAINGTFVFDGFNNFRRLFSDFSEKIYLRSSIKNSIAVYGVTLISTFFATLFSFYIFKKRALSVVYKLVLFMPHIISAVTLVLIFKYFAENAYIEIYENLKGTRPMGLITNPKTNFYVIMFFCMWTGFGTQVLMFSGAMSGINDSVIEAATLDGVTPFQEYLKIVVPMIWPTILTLLVVGLTGIFSNQMALFSFYGDSAPFHTYTFGYFMYRGIKAEGITNYTYYAAAGLLFTIIVIILTFTARRILTKIGPTQE